MTNKPKNTDQRFAISWGDPQNWPSQRQTSLETLQALAPDLQANPLSDQIHKIIARLEPEAARLKSEHKFVSVVICTQGAATDKYGQNSPEVMKECIASLFALSDLPVKIVFRLCTNQKSVLDFYKKMELDVECDVMGDYWNEVRDIVKLIILCCDLLELISDLMFRCTSYASFRQKKYTNTIPGSPTASAYTASEKQV